MCDTQKEGNEDSVKDYLKLLEEESKDLVTVNK